MKIQAPAGPLARMLKIVGRAVARTSTLPILGAMLFEVSEADGVLSISATDNELSVTLRAGAPGAAAGSAAVGARLLPEILRSLPPNEAATLSADAEGATLACAGGSYTMRVYPAKDFPKPVPFREEGAFSLEIESLAEAVRRVMPAASRDPLRPVLTGIRTVFEPGRLSVCATDSYRLAVYATGVEGGPEERQEAIIPARALTETLRILVDVRSDAPDLKTVEVSMAENAVQFRAGPVLVRGRLVEGAFPDHEKILPGAFETEIPVDAPALSETLSRIAPFAGRSNPPSPVRLSFAPAENLEGGELSVSAKSAEVGEATERIGMSVETGFAASFNGSYLLDGVKACSDGGLLLKANDPLKPVVLAPKAPKEGAEMLYLIMPMRDQDTSGSKAKEPATEPATA